MSGLYKSLESKGLLNTTNDLHKPKFKAKRYPNKAYCSSLRCTDQIGRKKIREEKFIEKTVKRDAVFCPDCGYALVWGVYDGRKEKGLRGGSNRGCKGEMARSHWSCV